MTAKKHIILFSGLTVFTVILFFGVNFWLKRLSPKGPSSPATPPPIPQEKSGTNPKDSDKIRVIRPDAVGDKRPIFYNDTGFQPKEITIKLKDEVVGCLITVQNKSGKTILVGLNPHLASGDRGVNYRELAPSEIGIYDVRYVGFTEAKLHNHYKPEHEMKVIYGEGCKL